MGSVIEYTGRCEDLILPRCLDWLNGLPPGNPATPPPRVAAVTVSYMPIAAPKNLVIVSHMARNWYFTDGLFLGHSSDLDPDKIFRNVTFATCPWAFTEMYEDSDAQD